MPAEIRHILLWNYLDEVPQEERDQLESALQALLQKVPSLRGIKWGPVVGGRNQSFSYGFIMMFDDQAGLDEYATHPDHVLFAGRFKAACAQQVVVDLEVVSG